MESSARGHPTHGDVLAFLRCSTTEPAFRCRKIAAKPRSIDHGKVGVQSGGPIKQYRFGVFVAGRGQFVDAGESGMFGISDLFQWERFVTPTIIKIFYWLAVVISILVGLAGAVSSLTTMAYNPFVGMIFLIASLLGACMGVVLSRIVAEFVLIVFRINEHLGAIRNQGALGNK
jgi:hypothetical protein